MTLKYNISKRISKCSWKFDADRTEEAKFRTIQKELIAVIKTLSY